MEEANIILELTDQQLDRYADKTSDYLFRKIKGDKKKRKNNAIRNTKELLEKYHLLKKRCNETVNEVEMQYDDFWTNGRLNVDSLMVNRAKTVIMMNYFDSRMNDYKTICDNERQSNKSRRYDILNKIYRENQSIDFVAGFFDKDRTTIIRNRDEAIEDMALLLFGIDVLNI